jgi:protein gp37
MSENTNIEWCDHTFNPWIGCTKVSPGCDGCYAARQDAFRHWTPEGWGGPRRRTKTWGEPKKWNGAHAAFFAQHGRRQRVFCASLADVFDNQVPNEWRVDLFRLIAATPNLDWLLLTKRIGNVAGMLPYYFQALPNVWLGATVVNQEEADRDIPKLLAVPARVRFLSMEPLLGPVDLRQAHAAPVRLPRVDWVIAGGESGPKARPMHPDWVRSLRDQCAAAGVPFLFKQWGEWLPAKEGRSITGRVLVVEGQAPFSKSPPWHHFADGVHMARIGKKAAGRLLDGVQHDGFPEVR